MCFFYFTFFLGFYIKTSETIVLSNEDLQFLVCSLHTGYAVIENAYKSRQTWIKTSEIEFSVVNYGRLVTACKLWPVQKER